MCLLTKAARLNRSFLLLSTQKSPEAETSGDSQRIIKDTGTLLVTGDNHRDKRSVPTAH